MTDRIGANGLVLVQRTRVQKGGWTKERRTAFLRELVNTCNVRRSCEAVGVEIGSAYGLRRRDEAFAELWREALTIGYERLEDMLLSRALEGVNAIDVAALIEDAGPAGEGGDDGGGGDDGSADGSGGGSAPVARAGVDPSEKRSFDMRPRATRALPHDVQIAMWLLARYKETTAGRGRVAGNRRPATQAETDAALTRKLDLLERRLKRAGQA